MELPFDGAISEYFETEAPDSVRIAIRDADKKDILDQSYPHASRMSRKRFLRRLKTILPSTS